MSRDWTKTLWPASFKGVPFWVDKDDEKGGRRVVVHEFPHSDTPFVEDLGQKAKCFSVTAYLVGDTSDGDASVLSASFDGDGSGTLVLPTHGPIPNCYCDDFSRSRTKDKLGLIAYEAHFWRDGPTNSPVTSPYLAQLAYDAISVLGNL
jgi:prophage DNA circulation protein